MKTKKIKVYNFEELSETAKEKALNDFNNNNDFPFLEEELNDFLLGLLEKNNIEGENIKLFYSLSYSQGDGVCFQGTFIYRGVTFFVKHNGHYYHENSKVIENDFEYTDELKGDFIELIEEEFNQLYILICKEIEKEGYKQIEYEQSEENFKEICDANEYTFRENGELEI